MISETVVKLEKAPRVCEAVEATMWWSMGDLIEVVSADRGETLAANFQV
jgi:hypothetical protein